MAITRKTEEDAQEWHHLDAQGKVLGRIATQTATWLMGKHLTSWRTYQTANVYVVMTNSDLVAVTGQKEERKIYRHNAGYPGGIRERSLREQRRRDSRVIIRQAIEGMLPKNNLRDKRLRHLKIYRGSEHPHQAQIKS